MAAINIVALLFIIVYYFAVIIAGVWGRRKVPPAQSHSIGPHGTGTSRRNIDDDEVDNYLLRLFVANRQLPRWLGVASMTATWVGGGYLNGTAEAVYRYGIVNCQAPLGYAMSLVLGGTFFATKMRLTDSLTMLDPFQTHYGRWSGLMFCVPAVLGEIFWTAAILSALGDTASVIIRVDSQKFIIISASIIFLTSLGGLFAVAYTDGLQLATTAILLWICVPSCVSHKAVGTLGPQYTDWIGSVESEDLSQALDLFLMTALGGIPWQVYFQRVLACKDVAEAKILSFLAALGCMFLAVAPVIVGVAAKHTNFTVAGYPGSYELNEDDSPRVLPFAILYLTTGTKAMFGLVSIAAAVMSSADSSMLSASTMIARNVYQTLFRPTATEKEVAIALRTTICALGSLSVYMALSVNSVFALWNLCSDIVYVLLFPQLLCLFYFKETNAYGSVLAFIVSGVFRCLCGEPSMNVPVVVQLPLYDPKLGQRFPFRLLSMTLGLVTLLLGSYATAAVFRRGFLPERWDVFRCFAQPSLAYEDRKASIGSFDHGTGTGSVVNENTAGAATSTRRVSTTDMASERDATTTRVSKDNRRPSGAPDLPDEAQDGKRLGTRRFSLASYRNSSLTPSVLDPTGTRDVSNADKASERETVPSGVSNDERRLSAELPDEAKDRSRPSTRRASLAADRKSSLMPSSAALTGTRRASTAGKASEREVITSEVSKGKRRMSVAAEPVDDAKAAVGPTRRKSSGAAEPLDDAEVAFGLTRTKSSSAPTSARRASAIHAANEKEAFSWGLPTNKQTQPLVAEPADDDQDGSGLNTRKASLTSVRKRSRSGMQSSSAHELSVAADKSLTEGAATETRTPRERSKRAGAKSGRKRRHRKSV
ncbi:high-affinity choline transporter 1-like [Dermacentor albipictus]|uniref:high-affinity choline transporter 1-like n=1 Tax=Dermacentor albipictus TaxID=60249 RepID=UPI0031FDAC58